MSDAGRLATEFLTTTDAQDWRAREALFRADGEFVTPMATLTGPAAMTAFSIGFMGAFSGVHHVLDHVVGEGDVAAVEGTWNGTHSGPLVTPAGEVAATGRSVELPFAAIVQTDGELITSVRIYFDQQAFAAQLGLIPESQPA